MRGTMLYGVVLLLCGGCGPADVAGEYSISVTNRENECGWANWTEGDQTTGVPVTVTQDEKDVTAVIGGLPRVVLDLVLGGHTFVGQVKGDDLDLTLFGTRTQTQGNCTYTTNGNLLAESNGDVLTGEILYTEATNGNPDCAAIAECVTRQVFNGTRPPQ